MIRMDTDELSQTDVAYESDGDLNVVDFPHICRICLATANLVPIFGLQTKQFTSKTKLTVPQLLRECVALKTKEDDTLPQNICLTCLRKLMDMYYYQKQCFLNQARLKLILLESQPNDTDTDLKIKEEHEDDDYVPEAKSEDAREGTKLVSNEDFFSHVVFKQDIESEEITTVNHAELEPIPEEDDEIIPQDNEDSAGHVYQEQYVDEYGRPVVYKFDGQYEEGYVDGNPQEEYEETYVQEGGEVIFHKGQEEVILQGREIIVQRDEEGNLINFGDVDTYEEVYDDGTYEEATEEYYHNSEGERYDAEDQDAHLDSAEDIDSKRDSIEAATAAEFIQIVDQPRRGRKPGVSTPKTHPQALRRMHEFCHLLPPGVQSGIIDTYDCNVCLRVMKRGYHFLRHLRRCDPDKFQRICDSITQSEDGQPPYCTTCEHLLRAVARRDNSKAKQSRPREKQHLCSVCGLSFSSKASLDSHFRRHTGERPFVCQVCKKTFSQGCGLDAHMRTHTGDRPFKCPYCDRRFTQAAHLITHVKTHTGERPYPCSHCGKRFALKGNLVVHERTHTGETPYLCQVCGKGFYDSSSRNKHQKCHESGEYMQRGRKRKHDGQQQQQQQQQRWKGKEKYGSDEDDSTTEEEGSSEDSDDSMMH